MFNHSDIRVCTYTIYLYLILRLVHSLINAINTVELIKWFVVKILMAFHTAFTWGGSSQTSSNTDHVFLLFAINGMGFALWKLWILETAQEGLFNY
jgi:hypothetical protein